MKNSKLLFCTFLGVIFFSSCERVLDVVCYDEELAARNKNTVCTADYDPVLGCNGETYDNECEANIAGVKVIEYLGDNGNSKDTVNSTSKSDCYDADLEAEMENQACLQWHRPVLGCDGEIYSNECIANMQGIRVVQRLYGPDSIITLPDSLIDNQITDPVTLPDSLINDTTRVYLPVE